MPYAGSEQCNVEGFCNDNTGFVIDLFELVAKKCNFTLRHKLLSQWGTEAVTGEVQKEVGK